MSITKEYSDAYPYNISYTDEYVLLRDGKEVMRGSEDDVWSFIHTTHSYSVEHALKHEGYKIIPMEQINTQ